MSSANTVDSDPAIVITEVKSLESHLYYLLCVLRLLFTCPRPVHPGVGHLSTFSCMARTKHKIAQKRKEQFTTSTSHAKKLISQLRIQMNLVTIQLAPFPYNFRLKTRSPCEHPVLNVFGAAGTETCPSGQVVWPKRCFNKSLQNRGRSLQVFQSLGAALPSPLPPVSGLMVGHGWRDQQSPHSAKMFWATLQMPSVSAVKEEGDTPDALESQVRKDHSARKSSLRPFISCIF